LLSLIPSLTGPARSVKDEILAFNLQHFPNAQPGLVAGGKTLDAADLGLSVRDRIDLIAIIGASEASVGVQRIESCGEQSAVVCMLVNSRPFFASLSILGVLIGAPEQPSWPNPPEDSRWKRVLTSVGKRSSCDCQAEKQGELHCVQDKGEDDRGGK
jgi:MCRA family